MIENPILTGFNPDPSICRVGDDYYIATSTFEWFPGVQIHHSRDLANWRLIGRALGRKSQLDMRGCQNSAGIWAPCLTHGDGKFWLLFTNVHHHGPGIVMDTPNYLVTADKIEGPWTDPVFLNASGFDPSLFHDDDGRKYVVQMQMGEALTTTRFDGILLREYDVATERLIGLPERIWEGSPIGITEGPHILKKDGWYDLITAEGGTSMRHAVSICRSRDLRGPYEIHPDNPILTSFQKDRPALKSAGHACFMEESWFSLTRRKGWLSLRGRDSLASPFDQSLVARRLQHFQASAETCFSFQPWNFKQQFHRDFLGCLLSGLVRPFRVGGIRLFRLSTACLKPFPIMKTCLLLTLLVATSFFVVEPVANPRKFHPQDWASLAKLAGMKYVMLTTKHHSGFCMYDTKTTEFSIMHIPFKRDITAEVFDAFRAQGISAGVYFSPDDFWWLRENKFTCPVERSSES